MLILVIFLFITVKARKIRFADEDEDENENEDDEEEESQNEDKVCKTFIIKYIPMIYITNISQSCPFLQGKDSESMDTTEDGTSVSSMDKQKLEDIPVPPLPSSLPAGPPPRLPQGTFISIIKFSKLKDFEFLFFTLLNAIVLECYLTEVCR